MRRIDQTEANQMWRSLACDMIAARLAALKAPNNYTVLQAAWIKRSADAIQRRVNELDAACEPNGDWNAWRSAVSFPEVLCVEASVEVDWEDLDETIVECDPVLTNAVPWRDIRIAETMKRLGEGDSSKKTPAVSLYPVGDSGLYRVSDGHHRTTRALIERRAVRARVDVTSEISVAADSVGFCERSDSIDAISSHGFLTRSSFGGWDSPTVQMYLSLGARVIDNSEYRHLSGLHAE